MNRLACPVVVALWLLPGSTIPLWLGPARADELPKDTNETVTLTRALASDLKAAARLGFVLTDGINRLTPEGARMLVEGFPEMGVSIRDKTGICTFSHGLALNGLESLDAATAKALAAFEGQCLSLNGLTALDAATAKALAAFEGDLSLSGLTTLDAAAAKALVEFKGDLWLAGLTTLDADSAKALAEFKSDSLYLSGLTTLSVEAAKALAEFKGERLVLNETATTKFYDTIPLTSETALAWVVVSNGELSRITAFDTPDSVAIAQALATRKGPLSIPNLKAISPKTLTALIEKQDVEIPLIETLELIPEPDGSATDDFWIPKDFQERQRRGR